MKSAHTPGPWQVFYMPASSDTDDEHHFALVANKNKSTFDENNSNARLMAAAPDLLEALQRLMPILNRAESNASGNPEWEDVSGRVNKARAAIAKATQ